MVTGVELDTGLVLTAKLALGLPVSTVTVPGTLATDGLLLRSEQPFLHSGPDRSTPLCPGMGSHLSRSMD